MSECDWLFDETDMDFLSNANQDQRIDTESIDTETIDRKTMSDFSFLNRSTNRVLCIKCEDGGAVIPGGGGSLIVGGLGSKNSFECTICKTQWQENNKKERDRLNGERGIQPCKRARHGEKKRGHANNEKGGYLCKKCGKPKKGHVCVTQVTSSSSDSLANSDNFTSKNLETLNSARNLLLKDLRCYTPPCYFTFKVYDSLSINDLTCTNDTRVWVFANNTYTMYENKIPSASAMTENIAFHDIMFKFLQNEQFSISITLNYNLPFPKLPSPHLEFTAMFKGKIAGVIINTHSTRKDAIDYALQDDSVNGIYQTLNHLWACCDGHIVIQSDDDLTCSFVVKRHTPITKDNGQRFYHCFCLNQTYNARYCKLCNISIDHSTDILCKECNLKFNQKNSQVIPDVIECVECAKKGTTRLCHIQCVMKHLGQTRKTLLADSTPYVCPLHA